MPLEYVAKCWVGGWLNFYCVTQSMKIMFKGSYLVSASSSRFLPEACESLRPFSLGWGCSTPSVRLDHDVTVAPLHFEFYLTHNFFFNFFTHKKHKIQKRPSVALKFDTFGNSVAFTGNFFPLFLVINFVFWKLILFQMLRDLVEQWKKCWEKIIGFCP